MPSTCNAEAAASHQRDSVLKNSKSLASSSDIYTHPNEWQGIDATCNIRACVNGQYFEQFDLVCHGKTYYGLIRATSLKTIKSIYCSESVPCGARVYVHKACVKEPWTRSLNSRRNSLCTALAVHYTAKSNTLILSDSGTSISFSCQSDLIQ